MSNKVYNRGAYGIPPAVVAQVKSFDLNLKWSKHARLAAVNDRYGVLPPNYYPRHFRFASDVTLVEAEVNEVGTVTKFVYRQSCDGRVDLVLVILRDGPHDAIVKTCWLNKSDDTHQTLDLTKFSKP